MQIFKAYFKVLKKHRMQILIYFVVFAVMTFIVSRVAMNTSNAAFTQTKLKVAVINREDMPISNGLKQYLEQNCTLVELDDKKENAQDALFYGEVEYVVTIPEGFTKGFFSGDESARIDTMSASGTVASVYMEFLLNRFLNIAALYVNNLPEAEPSLIADLTARDLKQEAVLEFKTGKLASDDELAYYFQFAAYCLLAMMITSVSMVMMAFNETHLKNRNLCAPIKQTRFNTQLVLANAVLAVVVWALLCIFIFAAYGKAQLNINTVLLCLNSLIFTLVTLCIGFFIGKFIKSYGVLSAISNVVTLGMSFLGGVFVSQDLLGPTVKTIGSFTPAYWYIKAVQDIRNLSHLDAQSIAPIGYSMLIQLAFAIALLITMLAVSKQHSKATAN